MSLLSLNTIAPTAPCSPLNLDHPIMDRHVVFSMHPDDVAHSARVLPTHEGEASLRVPAYLQGPVEAEFRNNFSDRRIMPAKHTGEVALPVFSVPIASAQILTAPGLPKIISDYLFFETAGQEFVRVAVDPKEQERLKAAEETYDSTRISARRTSSIRTLQSWGYWREDHPSAPWQYTTPFYLKVDGEKHRSGDDNLDWEFLSLAVEISSWLEKRKVEADSQYTFLRALAAVQATAQKRALHQIVRESVLPDRADDYQRFPILPLHAIVGYKGPHEENSSINDRSYYDVDETGFVKALRKQHGVKKGLFIEKLCELLGVYFAESLMKMGISGTDHGQNLMVEMDMQTGLPTRIVYRDLTDIVIDPFLSALDSQGSFIGTPNIDVSYFLNSKEIHSEEPKSTGLNEWLERFFVKQVFQPMRIAFNVVRVFRAFKRGFFSIVDKELFSESGVKLTQMSAEKLIRLAHYWQVQKQYKRLKASAKRVDFDSDFIEQQVAQGKALFCELETITSDPNGRFYYKPTLTDRVFTPHLRKALEFYALDEQHIIFFNKDDGLLLGMIVL